MAGNTNERRRNEILKRNPLVPVLYFSVFCGVLIITIFSIKNFTLSLNIGDAKKPTPPNSKIVNTPSEKEIVITQSEIEQAISSQATEYIKDPQVTITEKTIRCEGIAKKYFSTKVVVSGRPKIVDGGIAIEFDEAKIGPISAPKWIKDKVSDSLTTAINNKVDKNLQIRDIVLREKEIVIKLKEV